MKQLVAFGLLLALLLGDSGAGWDSAKTDDPRPKGVKLLVGGLWDVTRIYTATPTDKVTLRVKNRRVGTKFFC